MLLGLLGTWPKRRWTELLVRKPVTVEWRVPSLPFWNIMFHWKNHQDNRCLLAVLWLCVHDLMEQQGWYFSSRTGKKIQRITTKVVSEKPFICFSTRNERVGHDKRVVWGVWWGLTKSMAWKRSQYLLQHEKFSWLSLSRQSFLTAGGSHWKRTGGSSCCSSFSTCRTLCHGMVQMQEVYIGSKGDWTDNQKRSSVGC